MELIEKYLPAYLAVMSLVTFLMYGADKLKAKRKAWRIPEKTLLMLGLAGGAVGALCAMRLFRHKTRHWYFYLVNVSGVLLWSFIALKIYL